MTHIIFLILVFKYWRKLDIDQVSRIDFEQAKFYANLVMNARRSLADLEKKCNVKIEKL